MNDNSGAGAGVGERANMNSGGAAGANGGASAGANGATGAGAGVNAGGRAGGHAGSGSSIIECSQCGSADYTLLEPKTGEVMCSFCRSRWIVPALIQKTETEKYLEQQAKRPRVTIDNTTETDEKLMNMIGRLVGGGLSGAMAGVGTIIKRIFIGGGIALVLVIVTLILAKIFLG